MGILRMRARLVSIAAVACGCLVLGQGLALAAAPAPSLKIESFATPTNFSTEQNNACISEVEGGAGVPTCDAYVVSVTNAGSQPTDGSEIKVSDALPVGLTVQNISFFWSGVDSNLSGSFCDEVAVRCRFPAALAPDATLTMTVFVTVNEGSVSGALENTASVSGGGVPDASVSAQNEVASGLAQFDTSNFSFDF